MLWLKEIRKSQKMTSKEVCHLVNISSQHYNFIENGKRRPSVDVAKRIATVLNFDWTRFFTEPSDQGESFPNNMN